MQPVLNKKFESDFNYDSENMSPQSLEDGKKAYRGYHALPVSRGLIDKRQQLQGFRSALFESTANKLDKIHQQAVAMYTENKGRESLHK